MKTILIRGILWMILVAMIFPSAVATQFFPQTIDGTGDSFGFDTASGKVIVPDCILEEARAYWTTWTMDESFYSSGEILMVFDHLKRAKASSMPKIASGEYDAHEYAGLELLVRSQADPDVAARLRLRPRNQDDYPEYRDLVDLEIVFYKNYAQPGEQSSVQEYQLESYDLWNSIVRYTMTHYEPSMLKDVAAIEYHSLQNDPGARAMPNEKPSALKAIGAITNLLAGAEELDHNMVAMDYLHLRMIREDGSALEVYLQDPGAVSGGHFEPAPEGEAGYVYAQMGAKCYRLDKNAIHSALHEAGIPMQMLIG